jgi:hypothetical protein
MLCVMWKGEELLSKKKCYADVAAKGEPKATKQDAIDHEKLRAGRWDAEEDKLWERRRRRERKMRGRWRNSCSVF